MLEKAASLAAAIVPAALHSHVARAASAAGFPANSPVPVLVAATLLTLLPATLMLSALGRVVGRGTAATSAQGTPKVILVTGASSGLGKLLVDALRVAFPDAVVYGTSRAGWSAPPSPASVDHGVTRDDPNAMSEVPLGTESVADKGTDRQPLLALDVTDEASVAACVVRVTPISRERADERDGTKRPSIVVGPGGSKRARGFKKQFPTQRQRETNRPAPRVALT